MPTPVTHRTHDTRSSRRSFLRCGGGGLRGSQVIGSSTRDGGEVKDRPISPQDLWATVYSALGINLKAMFQDRATRPILILPDAEPIVELL